MKILRKKAGILLLILVLGILLLLGTTGCGAQVNKESYIEVNGTTLAYVQQGAGPPVILLHGGGGSCHDFDGMILELSEEYTVYAIDSRGHGESDPVQVYNYQVMADDVAAFIKAKGLKKPALYGFSDGGIQGLLVACQYPNLLSKLMVSGANTDPDGLLPEVRTTMEKDYEATNDGELKMELEQPHITAADLGKIKVPVLVTAGGADMVKESNSRFIADMIPDSELMILEDETHSSYVLDDDRATELLKAFLEE